MGGQPSKKKPQIQRKLQRAGVAREVVVDAIEKFEQHKPHIK